MSVSSAAPAKPPTADELMALPDDGIHRELIEGELKEQLMPVRNRKHSRVEARLAKILGIWLDGRPAPRGLIHSGDAGFRLIRDPETLVGIDIAYASAELVASTSDELAYYDGPPVLAVEILSPSDKHEEIVKKVALYPRVGTVVWVVDPDFQTVTVHQAGQNTKAFVVEEELSGEPYLPGFRIPVRRLFEDD